MPEEVNKTEPRTAAKGLGPVLTVAEVADALRVSTMTVYRLVDAGDLAALRIGRNIRIRSSDLEAFLTTGTIAADPSGG